MILQKKYQTLLVFQRYNKILEYKINNPKTICKSKLTNNIKKLTIISFSSQVY